VIPCLQVQNDGLVRCRNKNPYISVLQALLQLIPLGKVVTYNELALLMGTSPRIIGKLLKLNDKPIIIPCHRVIRADCALGGYTYQGRSNPRLKRRLLELEGIKLSKHRVRKEHCYHISKALLS
jgi:methylated-DNA-[protein]-cysteine S-methyltransferase